MQRAPHILDTHHGGSRSSSGAMVLVQWISLAWLLLECAVAIDAASAAHSPLLLAFGADSLVELLSGAVLVFQWLPGSRLSERTAARAAAVLLFVLALVVGGVASAQAVLHLRPESSPAGIAIAAAALFIMPVLARLKRNAARRSGNAALAADAVQSAACAYLAALTLLGLALNTAFGIAWVDPLAALVAVPILVKEGREAWRGHLCACS